MVVDMHQEEKVLSGGHHRKHYCASPLLSAPVPPIVWQGDASLPFGNFGACCTVFLLMECCPCIVCCVTAGNRTAIRNKLKLKVRGLQTCGARHSCYVLLSVLCPAPSERPHRRSNHATTLSRTASARAAPWPKSSASSRSVTAAEAPSHPRWSAKKSPRWNEQERAISNAKMKRDGALPVQRRGACHHGLCLPGGGLRGPPTNENPR